jgi:hypothetical protein
MARYFVGRKADSQSSLFGNSPIFAGRAAVLLCPGMTAHPARAACVRACVFSPSFRRSQRAILTSDEVEAFGLRRRCGSWLLTAYAACAPPCAPPPPVPGRYDDAAQHHDTTTRRQRNRHHQRQSSPTAQTRHTSRHAPPARPAGLCSCHRRWPMPMPRPPLSQPPPSPARRRSHQVHRRRTYFRDRARCFAAGLK